MIDITANDLAAKIGWLLVQNDALRERVQQLEAETERLRGVPIEAPHDGRPSAIA